MGDIRTVDASLEEHQYTTPANTTVNVGVASTQILAANSDRLYAAITNDSDTEIYLGIGAAAVAGQGVPLTTKGSSYEINWTNLYQGVVNVICSEADKLLIVTEGTNDA